jgi:hypothetical protein
MFVNVRLYYELLQNMISDNWEIFTLHKYLADDMPSQWFDKQMRECLRTFVIQIQIGDDNGEAIAPGTSTDTRYGP